MARRSARERGITLSAPAWTWAWLLVLAATQFWLGVLALTPDGRMGTWFGWLCLCLGCASTARAWKLGTLRVDMTSHAVTVRGLRRRTIAWQDIRTIEERRSWLYGRVVEIAPKTGKLITALVSASWLDDTFERDHRLLEQRWRAWTSVEADRSPVSSPPR